MRPWQRALLRFVAAVVFLDVAIGFALSRAYHRTRTGEGGGLVNHMLTKDADVLVLGSSRAKHHVVPSLLGEKLGLTVYNAGTDGQSFLFATMLLDLWKARHPAPRAIVLHVDADTFRGTDEELQKTAVLSAYVDESAHVREVLYARTEFERVKYVSRTYRFNGKVLPIAKNLFVKADPAFDGYEALTAVMDPRMMPPPKRIPRGAVFSARTRRYFEDLVAYCRQYGVRLFLVHSPQFVSDPALYGEWMPALGAAIGAYPEVELLAIDEVTHASELAGRAELFADEWHLNAKGAEVFTTLLAAELVQRGLSSSQSRQRSLPGSTSR